MLRTTVSFEKIGTTAYWLMVVTDSNGARVGGLDETDFTFKLMNPANSDIAGATSFTVVELGSSKAYVGSFTLPNPEGAYALTIFSATYPPVTGRHVTFLAFVTEFGDSGDASAQIDFRVTDEDGIGVTGLATADFTWNIWDPSLNEASGPVAVTFVELGNGEYRAEFDASIQGPGKYFLDLLTTDGDGGPNYWTPGGKQAVYKYKLNSAEVAGKPGISAAENDNTGTSGTLTLVADDAGDDLYVYYRTVAEGLWTLFGSREGSGDLQVTGLTNNILYEFMCIASRSGSPLTNPSPPSEPKRIYITDGATVLTALWQALYDWVDAQVPLTVVWAPANAPEKGRPFVAIRAGPLMTIMEDSHSGPDDAGVDTIVGDREFMFTAEVLGPNAPENTGGDVPSPKPLTFDYAERVSTSLQKRSVLDTLAAAGIAFVEVLPTQDLTGIGSIDFQVRALVEVRFRIASEITDQLNWIDTAENPQGTYSL